MVLFPPGPDWLRSLKFVLEKQAPLFLDFFKTAISPGPTLEGPSRGPAKVLVGSGRNYRRCTMPRSFLQTKLERRCPWM